MGSGEMVRAATAALGTRGIVRPSKPSNRGLPSGWVPLGKCVNPQGEVLKV